ncbi:LytR C-terminal domain-containing protein [Massilia norwichensis]|uniref:LytR C-terminal domain-containing protein n=1 Tax=Massilia norwichensis TaxID=1442366 RepID=A0ABT2A983_9BURK|nr:LytR C-terminal domain-containing protein [Massilia norwichensis]MCS0590717.1 LytR C-terminal domain-containing protein [Massilia norwichensis]
MRARILTHTLPLLCSSALLMACSSPPLQQAAAQTVAASAADNYLRGRNLHLAHRYEEAIAAYQAALKADSSHVNARNGLAIAYAEQRDFAKAIPIWRELTHGATMASGTDTAFLFGNLGHAYFLNGQYDDALVALEKACLLDPLNHRTWQRLGETLQQLGQDERAGQMLRQASALRDHDFRADYAAADGGARLPAIEQALKTPQRPDQDWASVEVTTRPNGMLELRRVAPNRTASSVPPSRPAVPPLPKEGKDPLVVVALEISNGNGRQGLARLMSRQLRDADVKVVRLTNEKGFAVRQTRIEYQPAFRSVAERLAERYAATTVEVNLNGRTNMRLVIGRDLPAGLTASRAPAVPAGQGRGAAAP